MSIKHLGHKPDTRNEAIDPELSGGEAVAKGFNVLCGEVGQDDRFHASFDDICLFLDIHQSAPPSKRGVHT